jgi:5-methylcytosine-specific restriction endonuclease McrA
VTATSCQVRTPGVCTVAATCVDHIVEAVRGGTDDPSNLRASCQGCNLDREHRRRRGAGPARWVTSSSLPR